MTFSRQFLSGPRPLDFCLEKRTTLLGTRQRKFPGCESAFDSSKSSAKSFQKPQPGFLARSIRSHQSLRIRESVPGPLADCYAVPRGGCLDQRVLRVASACSVATATRRSRARRPNRGALSTASIHLWPPAHSSRSTRCAESCN